MNEPALPELPKVALPALPKRFSYQLEASEDDLTPDREIDVFTADQMQEYAHAALAQAAPIAQPEQQEAQQAMEVLNDMTDAAELMMAWCVKNVKKWSFPEYDQLSRCIDRARSASAAAKY